ncbi:MAG TPA: FAD-dependent oxidoreductase [Anaerolineae bacterium]
MSERIKVLLAAAVGVIAGLLLAPKAGKETRARLKEAGQAVKDRAVEELAGAQRRMEQYTRASTPRPGSELTEGEDYDVIVVGGGHNGLVTAAYLARAGRRVLVLERRPLLGGAAVTEQFFSGFNFSSVADGAGYLSSQIGRDLDLRRHGLRFLPADPAVFAPQPDGSHLTIWHDAGRTAQEIARFSSRDAARYPEFVEQMSKMARVIGGLMTITPPDLPELSRSDLAGLLKLARPVRALGRQNLDQLLRVLPMSAADLLDEWFESEALKSAIAANGVRDITWGPREAGTVYTLLYRWAGSRNSLFRSAGQIKGGIGALTQALAGAACSRGAEIRTGAEVAEIVVQDGRASGVRLADGEEITAAVVASSADPRTTFLRLLNPLYLDRTFVRHVQNIKYRGAQARVHLALRRLPTFTSLDGAAPVPHLCNAIQIAPSMDYLQRAYDPVKYGEMSERPYLDIRIPSLADPDLAPPDRHVMSLTVQYAPYHLRHGTWDDNQRQALSEIVLDTLAEYAPNIRDAILYCQVMTPLDLEQTYGLPEGNPNHGEMTLDQFFHMRPVPGYAQYRTPVQGLYLCGAGAHPGGGVTGIPGRNAAHQILKQTS